MQLIEIVGPPASGKTTVMRALQRLTSFEAYAFVEEAPADEPPLLACADSLVAALANKLAARFVRTLGAAAAPPTGRGGVVIEGSFASEAVAIDAEQRLGRLTDSGHAALSGFAATLARHSPPAQQTILLDAPLAECAERGLNDPSEVAAFDAALRKLVASQPTPVQKREWNSSRNLNAVRDAILCAPPPRRLSAQEYAPPSAEATKRWLRTKWAETGYRPEATMAIAAPSPKVAASPAAPSPTFVGALAL